MIDLSRMRAVRVDPAATTARVQGGATWGDVDRETQLFGLATPGGVVSGTGRRRPDAPRRLGLAAAQVRLRVDNILSVEIVTADGQVRTASADRECDLYWAVRGGGGNFGVVTSFEFQLHPVGPVVYLAALSIE